VTLLLLDEMFSGTIAAQLRPAGIDVVCIVENPQLRSISDAEVLDLATSEMRVLVTGNIRDFEPLNQVWAAQQRQHGGMLYVSSGTFPVNSLRTGNVAKALLQRHSNHHWPAPGQIDFLLA